ncbi:hypothetical protein [Paenibacillus thiaminolyticus]|uniref:hypothetical protein n=1 Tax=Paenibacillus thiaminolyticus TaxID=49283 RepID=UPI0016030BC1|nr:hypothetical protein [Paenibacillus thiaminolyticus]
MNVAELYDGLPIELPRDVMDALASHHAKQVAGEFFLKLMNRDEIIELHKCLADVEEFQDILPLWSDDNSNYVGLYCRGPLQNKVCYISHEETDLSPGFRSVSSFLASLEQSPDLDWDDLKKDYPAEADIDTQHLEDDRKCIDELMRICMCRKEHARFWAITGMSRQKRNYGRLRNPAWRMGDKQRRELWQEFERQGKHQNRF